MLPKIHFVALIGTADDYKAYPDYYDTICELISIKVSHAKGSEGKIFFWIADSANTNMQIFEKNLGSGVDYYLASDIDLSSIKWIKGTYLYIQAESGAGLNLHMTYLEKKL